MCKEYIWICTKCRRQKPGETTQKDPCKREECDRVFLPIYLEHLSWCNDCNNFRHFGDKINLGAGWRPAAESIPGAPPNPAGPVGPPSTFDSTPHRQLSDDQYMPAMRRTASSLNDAVQLAQPAQHQSIAPPSTGLAGPGRGSSQQGSREVGSIAGSAPQARAIVRLPQVPDIVNAANNAPLPKNFAPRLLDFPVLPPKQTPPRLYIPLQFEFQNSGAAHPLRTHLAPLGWIEPEEWERWRTNQPHSQFSKNARYQNARSQLPDWYLPLPYEPERYYIERRAAFGQTNVAVLRSHHWWREYFDHPLRHPNRARAASERQHGKKLWNQGDPVTNPMSEFDPKTSKSFRGGHNGGRGGRGGGGDRGGPGGAAGGFLPVRG